MKILKNSNGFSLVQTMVAAGITGGLALVSMKLFDNINMAKQQSDVNQESREMLSEMRFMLENDKNCVASMKDASGTALTFVKSQIDNTETKQGKNLELWLSNADGTQRTTKKFSAGTEYGKLKITSIQLYMNNGTTALPSGASSDIGTVRVKYTNKVNAKSYTKDFMVNIESQTSGTTSTITGCSRNPVRNVCDSVNMTYDPATGKCTTPADVCDGWQMIGNADGWTGWRSQACTRLPGGFVQSIRFSQQREGSGDKDWNGMHIRCCYSKKMETSNCTSIQVENTNWWTGTREGNCSSARAFVRKIDFYQYRWNSGDRETNTMTIQCCTPN